MSHSSLKDHKLPLVRQYFQSWQSSVVSQLRQWDTSANYISDEWTYESGRGGGLSCILSDGDHIDQGGVNFSHIFGDHLPITANDRMSLNGCPFEALGTSIVIHPHNPFVPAAHANLRFIRVTGKDGSVQWWFGGGYDLTPCYVFEEDALTWHQAAKKSCDVLGPGFYSRYKKQCDRYFYLKHRQETRGIGGLFFDNLNERTTADGSSTSPCSGDATQLVIDFDRCFEFVRAVGCSFANTYAAIVQARQACTWQDQHKAFQHYRRGRYVEFNLLYDRGTHFGLQSGGRVASIFMSMPPQVNWCYQLPDHLQRDQDKLLPYLCPRDWLPESH